MSEILYSAEHLWFEVEKDRIKMGITDSLKERIAPTVIRLSNVGASLCSGSPVAVLESNKLVYELTLPFKCTIVERNEQLLQLPACLSRQTEKSNWLYIAEINDEHWDEKLMNYEEYQSFIEP